MNTDNYTIAWICWYDNGTVTPTEYKSTTHTLNDLPDDGFQAMRLWYIDGTGRYISGSDYYFFEDRPGGIIYGQSNDPIDEIRLRYPNAIIKRGKHVPDGLMAHINNLMLNSTIPL